ncbi:phenylacetate--CoA ligase family protein [candidate division WOR-3 bacterium]|nr:phenylacetate--CoA ligase family protein [candidate division WOR-3 bacterium]
MDLREIGLALAGTLSRDRFYSYYKELDRNQWLSGDALTRLQLAKLRRLITHAATNIPFYKKRFADFDINAVRSPDDIKLLPVLTKSELAEAGEDAVVRGGQRLVSRSTSGTSGAPFRFVVSRDFFSFGIARHLRIFDLPGLRIGDPWVFCTPLRYKTNPVYSFLTNRLVLDANQITRERTPPCCPASPGNRLEPDEVTIRRFCKQIKSHKPGAIFSYPSTLIALATFIRKWRVPDIKIRTIISSGEVLPHGTRKFCEETFEGEVYNLYGTTEFPSIAQECGEHKGLHIFSDSYLVECLDDGAIVITDLDNYTMPFIRFKIGDHGFLKGEQCRCGRALPLMEITQGRISDLLITRDGRFLRRSFFAAVLEKNREIRKFEITQDQRREITISILLAKPLSDARRQFLMKRFNEYAGGSIAIKLQPAAGKVTVSEATK